jgi:hypothetical protein
MIFLLIVLFLVLLAAGGIVVRFGATRAPEGWEDGRGFHVIVASAGAEIRPGLAADFAGEGTGIGSVAAGAPAEAARRSDLELPFGAC